MNFPPRRIPPLGPPRPSARQRALAEWRGVDMAPLEKAQALRSKAVAEAIALIRQAADRTGAKWEAVIAQTPPAAASRNEGLGFGGMCLRRELEHVHRE